MPDYDGRSDKGVPRQVRIDTVGQQVELEWELSSRAHTLRVPRDQWLRAVNSLGCHDLHADGNGVVRVITCITAVYLWMNPDTSGAWSLELSGQQCVRLSDDFPGWWTPYRRRHLT